MGFVIPVLAVAFFALLLRGWWRIGYVPTVLWFNAERSNNPLAFWPFFLLGVGAWCWFVGYLVLAILDPSMAPQLHGKDRLDAGELIWAGVMLLGSGLFAWWELRDSLRRRLIAAVKALADDLSPDEEGWGVEEAELYYSLKELKRLRKELERIPKGHRQLKAAMQHIERGWER